MVDEPTWEVTHWRDRAMGGLVHLTYLLDFRPLRVEVACKWESSIGYGHWSQTVKMELSCPEAPDVVLHRGPDGLLNGPYFTHARTPSPNILTETLELWALESGLDPLTATICASDARPILLADSMELARGWPRVPPRQGVGFLPQLSYRDLVVPLTRVRA